MHCCKLGALTIQNSFKISAEPKLRMLPPPQLEICCGIIKSSQTHDKFKFDQRYSPFPQT